MHVKHLALGAIVAAGFAATVMATKAEAQDTIYVPLMTYRTGPFAGSGTPIANGMHDYLSMLDERDAADAAVAFVQPREIVMHAVGDRRAGTGERTGTIGHERYVNRVLRFGFGRHDRCGKARC